MALTIDYETLTLDEAEALEELTNLGMDEMEDIFRKKKGPGKMKLMKGLSAIAYQRAHGGTYKAAAAKVGEIPLTEFAEQIQATSGEHPTTEGEQ